MPFHVMIAGLFHETHTFLSGRTRLEDFDHRIDQDLLALIGEPSPLGGVLEYARDASWTVIPAVDMRAMPGPLVDDSVVDLFWRRVRQVIDGNSPRIDGVLLVLHGAMVAESCDDVEGQLLERVWKSCGHGTVPICAVLDLHANLSSRMVRHAHGLVAYRQNPHTDAREAAIDAARLLDRLMHEGLSARTVGQSTSLMWPPTGTGTAEEPMASLQRSAREIEMRHPSILAVNVLAGFAFADTPHTGVSFSATTLGDPVDARRELARLAQLAVLNRALGNRQERSVADVVADISRHDAGPIVVTEPSDNIGAGASGAGTGLLRALLDHGINGAVITLNDPAAVTVLAGKHVGDSVVLMLGAKDTPLDPDPIEIAVELVSTSNGSFELEDPQSHLASISGSRIEMGPCAVVRHRGIRILLTSRKTPPFDLGQLRSQGIEPETAFVIGVKAAVAHRRAYDPIAKAHYSIATPGPCSSDLRLLPYRNVRRPMYPLDT